MHPFRCIRHTSVLVLGLLPLLAGCLDRPVSNASPDTQTIFTQKITQGGVDRVDLLFMIDNSRSMGDKQSYLSQAVPSLLTRLLTPNCVDDADPTKVLGVSQNGACSAGRLEFPPVHDMHIAIVSSSMGDPGGDQCTPPSGGPDEMDDDAELVNRGNTVADAPEGFLGWFPGTADNAGAQPTAGTPPVTDPKALVSDFQGLVTAIGQSGCGLESQLESWYRFLVQPDPYQSIVVDSVGPVESTPTGPLANEAILQGVDATILKQRHDFLRPDSLVAIIDLTDENDSWVDARSYNATPVGGILMNNSNYYPYRGTSACATDPASADCFSCADQRAAGDPACAGAAANYGSGDPQYDVNVRHVHMRASFGVDQQFPLSRYVNGLTQTTVPDRDGEYPSGAQSYQGNADCSNPLFSQDLPDGTSTDPATLCHLTPGPRDPSLIYYAHIGGVPSALLHFDPTSAANSELTDADWQKILGNAPDQFDYGGIDPTMAETYQSRPNPQHPDQTYWDLKYACTFPLATPRDCTQVGATDGCDCAESQPGPGTSGWELCDPSNPTSQIAAKAYPTPRELELAKLMGTQGVVSSLCPIHTDPTVANDPLYGYQPAMAAILYRLQGSLSGTCVPHKLRLAGGSAPCQVLASLPQPGQSCDPGKGMTATDPQVIAEAAQSLAGNGAASLLDTTQHTVCTIGEVASTDLVNGTCTGSTSPGWCYVEGAAAGLCSQALLFSPTGQPAAGVQTLMTCSESIGAPVGD